MGHLEKDMVNSYKKETIGLYIACGVLAVIGGIFLFFVTKAFGTVAYYILKLVLNNWVYFLVFVGAFILIKWKYRKK